MRRDAMAGRVCAITGTRRSSRRSYERDAQRRLWEASETLLAPGAGAGAWE